MIKGWDILTLLYGGISGVFIWILLFGEPNMFTFPLALLFTVGTIYCALQWGAMNIFKKIEAKRPDWK